MFFDPRWIKEAHAIGKNGRKLLNYHRDLLPPETVTALEESLATLRAAVKQRDPKTGPAQVEATTNLFGKLIPAHQDAAWRENVEVYLVAIVIAIGVRAYFLQPFTIPTGSMQPTLNGIIGHQTVEPPPGILQRVFEQVWLGRSYVNLVAKEDDVIMELHGEKKFFFFMYTKIITAKGHTWSVRMPVDQFVRDFSIAGMRQLKAGQVIARGYIDTGDHVFVDKFSYNFRPAKRGEVFVFNTKGIGTRDNREHPDGPSQFYIKRLAGVPGDTLRIAAPELLVNGQRAQEFGFNRVMAARNGYRGYGNIMSFNYLATPADEIQLPAAEYFALGDNSYNSSDSRDWGTVPERNLTGHGLFVYWPFGAHWGLIR